ncbi:Alpha/Beta hydrolase protein [Cercophora newfieldiana]|uniref:Alpha/Beta hydrolase protein n=1 Tax=Cercophora newfieldiana TaxID=92897 RepID=A0AA39XUT2_9PEZI|nr:Alpha/Beta hydrolase protein [Cercophora newfieldiana]
MASLAFPQWAKKATLSDGTTYGYIHVPAAESKPTFLLLHGAPSSSYVWRHQVDALPKAGFGVIAPDLLGYGDTDKPEEEGPYQMHCMVPQIYELVTKAIGIDKVIGVGHDLGSPLLSHIYVHHKPLFSGLVFIAVGFTLVTARFDPDFLIATSTQLLGYPTAGYTRLFVSPDGASLLDTHSLAFSSLLYTSDPTHWKTHLGAEGGLLSFLHSGETLPIAPWLSPAEFTLQNAILAQGGYTGPLNWYKSAMNLPPAEEDVRLTEEEKRVEVPTLLVVPERDFVIVEAVQVHMTGAVAGERMRVEKVDAGHWAMLERREEVEGLLEGFGRELELGGGL